MRSLVITPTKMNWSDWMRQNEVVRTWSVKVKKQLRGSAKQFTKGKRASPITVGNPPRPEYKLANTLKHRVFYKQGISEGTSFRFQRHGVFRHYGTGRGYKRIGGQVIRVKKSYSIDQSARVYEQIDAPHRRQPADWFNPIIDHNMPELAHKVTEVNADAALNAMRMRIK